MDTLRDLAGAPRRASAAFAGGREVVPMMKCRIDDYKNVLEVLSQDSSDTFKHEVKRLGDLLKRLETLYATHTETKNGIVSFVKATNRGCLHEEIKNDISAIDAEAIRQLTAVAAVAAKSAIGHELTRRGPWGFPAATGDPKGSSFGGDAQSFGRYAPGPGLVGSSEPPKGLGDRGTVRDYRVSTRTRRQRNAYVVIVGMRVCSIDSLTPCFGWSGCSILLSLGPLQHLWVVGPVLMAYFPVTAFFVSRFTRWISIGPLFCV